MGWKAWIVCITLLFLFISCSIKKDKNEIDVDELFEAYEKIIGEEVVRII